MQIRVRPLIVIAGLALPLPFALAAGDEHRPENPPAHPAPAPAQHDEPKATSHEEAAPAKAKPSIWDAAKSSRGKPADKSAGDKKKAGDKVRTQPGDKQDDKSDDKASANPHDAAQPEPEGVNADDALEMLAEGNARWVAGRTQGTPGVVELREELAANGQHPFVTILTCADSRVPVERVFDRGVGEIFVVRVAGNVAGASEAGTIEYGTEHLKTKLLVVMGHTKCGAVAAACSGATLHGKVGELVAHVTPAVDRAKRNNPGVTGDDLAAIAVRENVWQSVYDLLSSSSEVRELMSKNELRVCGAVYDIASGRVEFLGEHPWQTELIGAINAATNQALATAGAAHPTPAATPTPTPTPTKPIAIVAEPAPTTVATEPEADAKTDAAEHH